MRRDTHTHTHTRARACAGMDLHTQTLLSPLERCKRRVPHTVRSVCVCVCVCRRLAEALAASEGNSANDFVTLQHGQMMIVRNGELVNTPKVLGPHRKD